MPMRYWVRLGFRRDGRVMAKEIKMWADNGAYTGKSQAILGAASVRHDALYKYPCARGNSTLVYTNLVPTGAFRGFGNPSADWAVEQAWDLAAEKLGIDVLDLLRMNAVDPGDVSPHNHKITSCELKQCIDKAADADRLAGEAREQSRDDPHARSTNPLAGWAWAAACTSTAAAASATGTAAPPSCASTRTAAPRSSPARARSARAISRCCGRSRRRSWDCPTSDVDITRPDTDVHPHSLGALASRAHLRRRQRREERGRGGRRSSCCEAAAEQFKRPASELTIINGEIGPAQRPRDRVQAGRRRRAREHLQPGGQPIVGVGNFDNPSEFPDHNRYGNESGAYNFIAQAAEVEVDRATGEVKLLEIASAVDCGTVINPATATARCRAA